LVLKRGKKADNAQAEAGGEKHESNKIKLKMKVAKSEEATEPTKQNVLVLKRKKKDDGGASAGGEVEANQPPSKKKKKAEQETQELYCFCRQPYDERFMVQCDGCQEWFHGDCVGVKEEDNVGDEWRCSECLKAGHKRGSKKRAMTAEQEEEEGKPAKKGFKLIIKPTSGELKTKIKIPKPEPSSSALNSVNGVEVEEVEEEGMDVSSTPDSWWLHSYQPSQLMWPYIPQEGDDVVYISSAHRTYLKAHKDPRSATRRAPFQRFASLPPAMSAKISRVQYEIIAKVPHMVITLLMDPPIGYGRTLTRHQKESGPVECDVLFHPGIGPGSDFLVHQVRYDRAQKDHWGVGDLIVARVESPVTPEGKEISRTVVSVEYEGNDEEEIELAKVKDAPWLEVASGEEKKGEGHVRIGSWAVEREERKRKGGRFVLAGSGSSASGHPKLTVPELDDDALAKAQTIIEKAMRDPQVQPFIEAVTDEIAPGYSAEVACPMYLTFIDKRLQYGYYRQKEAIMADVRLIHTNCAKFNGVNEEISLVCKEVTETIEKRLSKI